MNVALYYHYSFNTAVEKKEKKKKEKRDERALIDYAYCPATFYTSRQLVTIQIVQFINNRNREKLM